MKRIYVVMMVLASVAIGGVPLYIYHIYYKGSFSTNNQDWGNFGSFIGGTTGAILSTISLIILIYTLHITIRNAQEQLTKQQENHEAQMEQQKTIHDRERDMTRYSMNIQLLNNYIDILNKKLDSKVYNFYSEIRHNYSSENEKEVLQKLFNMLRSELLSDTNSSLASIYNVIGRSKITYVEELVPISNILGIIGNETNERQRANYISIFLAGTHRERTLWLLYHTINSSEEAKLVANENPSLLALPENLVLLFKKYKKLA